ncbi:CoA transferase [Cryobacterium sp. Y57]|nr:CoA transferase [Cryobacterium sp. Y57]
MIGNVDATLTTGPLDGIRVADFSRVLAGPFATLRVERRRH